MAKRLLLVVLFAAVVVAAGAGSSAPDPAVLRQEVLDFVGGAREYEFRGVVEFERLMEIGPDPAKVERANRLAEQTEASTFDARVAALDARVAALRRCLRDRMRERDLTAGLEGEAINQAWRIVAGDDGKLRVEFQTHALHPPEAGRPCTHDSHPPVFRVPALTVAAKNGETSWLWRGTVPGNHGYGERAHPVERTEDNLLDQAGRELQWLFSVLPGWPGVLRAAELQSVEETDGAVVAELAGARDAAGREQPWSLRLEFERGPSGLLLTRRLHREARRYSDTRFADYRPVAGRMVPYQRTVRSGPLEEFGAPLRPLTVPKSYIDTYRVLAIREGLDPADLALFDPPPGALDRPAALEAGPERQFTYEDISGPGSQPLVAAAVE